MIRRLRLFSHFYVPFANFISVCKFPTVDTVNTTYSLPRCALIVSTIGRLLYENYNFYFPNSIR